MRHQLREYQWDMRIKRDQIKPEDTLGNNIRPLVENIHIVGDIPVPGRTIIFCNGIMNSSEDAKESATAISNIYDKEQIVVFHSTTTLNDVLDEKNKKRGLLVIGLTRIVEICYLYHSVKGISDADICISIFAHSYGAYIVEGVLETLSIRRDIMRVYTFGPALVIPKTFARLVQNYMFDLDAPCQLANSRLDKDRVLFERMRIERAAKNRETTKEAIVSEEVINALKRGRYKAPDSEDEHLEMLRLLRWKQYEEVLSQGEGKRQYSELMSPFDNYDIVCLDGTAMRQYGGEGILATAIDFMGQAVEKNHAFKSYIPLMKAYVPRLL